MTDLEKLLTEKNYDYHWDNDTIVITYDGYVSLDSLNKITTNVTFNNSGNVYLNSLEEITTNITFNNSGNVSLNSLEEITTNITFNNSGYVYLDSLKEITTNIIFNNKGDVYLDSLKELNYFGKKYKIINIDGFTIIVIGTPKVKNGITITKTRFLKGNGLTNCPISYIAQKDNYYSHGKTIKEAIDDLNFKLIKNVDLKEIVKEIKTTNKVTKNQYRLITGACNQGIEQFKSKNNIKSNTISLSKCLKLIKNEYGSTTFINLIKG